MEKSQQQYCPLCSGACPIEKLHCRKGKAYFSKDGSDQSTEEKQLPELLAHCGIVMMHHKGHGHGRGQGKVLKLLLEAKTISQKVLQEKLDIQPGSLSELLSKLEHKGMITREKDENDKRSSIIALTPKGEEKAQEVLARHQQEHKPTAQPQEQSKGHAHCGGKGHGLLVGLDEQEKEQLATLLRKLEKSWADMKPHHGKGHGHCKGHHHEGHQHGCQSDSGSKE